MESTVFPCRQFYSFQPLQDPKLRQRASPVVEVEDISTFVNNIVYCRDPKVLSKLEESSRNMTQPGYYNLRLLIQHENFLDVKQLIRTTNMVSECERYESNRMKQKKKVGGGIKVGNDTDALV